MFTYLQRRNRLRAGRTRVPGWSNVVDRDWRCEITDGETIADRRQSSEDTRGKKMEVCGQSTRSTFILKHGLEQSDLFWKYNLAPEC